MIEGIVNIYKEQGYTSHDVIYRLRKITHIKKIGHTGTLDPMACGVLPVCIGKATKVCELIMDWNKTYIATMRLGIQTDSQDITGNIIKECDPNELINISEEQIRKVIMSFVGEIRQIPPMYSAKKINGQKMYDLARKGIEVEREAKTVSVFEIKIIDIKLPEIRLEVTCSKGTYIRTICHDIGEKLGVGAVMTSLERTKVGIFGINDSIRIDDFAKFFEEDNCQNHITGIDRLFLKYSPITVTHNDETPVRHGNFIKVSDYIPENITDQTLCQERSDNDGSITDSGIFRIYAPSGDFLALYEIENKYLRPLKMFV